MKKKAIILAGVLTLAIGAYCGTKLLWAQQPAAQPAAPTSTRVAVINLGMVIEKYEKTIAFKKDQENTFLPLKKELDELAGKLKQWTEYLKTTPNLAQKERDQYEAAIRDHKRILEDKEMNIRKIMAKKVEEQTVQLYREIEEGVKRFAAANGFQLVLNHGELINEAEIYSAMNIERKIQGAARTGCCAPLYVAPGLDITQQVLANLNAQFPRAQAPATPRPGG